MAGSCSKSDITTSTALDLERQTLKVALVELSSLRPGRSVYLKQGPVLFRTTHEKARLAVSRQLAALDSERK